MPCPRPCISSNATIELWQHVNRCQLRLGQGISRSKTHDALQGRLVTVGTQKHCRPRSPSWRHLPAVTRARSSPTNRPLQRPLPRLFLLKGPAEGPAHAWCDHKGEVTQCMQPTGTASGGPLAQQRPMLRHDRPRIRMTWRTLARGSLGAGALAYKCLCVFVGHRVQSAWLEFS